MRNQMRMAIKQGLQELHLYPLAREFLKLGALLGHQAKRKLGLDRQAIERYLHQNKSTKLHIGCGDNILDGWLNSDYHPLSPTIPHIDATRPFPLDSEKFDYVFSEHMIEHISYPQGLSMLAECHRVLKTGGKIRIATPDLSFLIDLYRDKKTDLQKEYIRWTTDNILKDVPYSDATFVINNYVRDWGHLFIYDERTLRSSLERVGFGKIVRCELHQSEDESLRNLENDRRMPGGFLKLETIVLEGTKLAVGQPHGKGGGNHARR